MLALSGQVMDRVAKKIMKTPSQEQVRLHTYILYMHTYIHTLTLISYLTLDKEWIFYWRGFRDKAAALRAALLLQQL